MKKDSFAALFIAWTVLSAAFILTNLQNGWGVLWLLIYIVVSIYGYFTWKHHPTTQRLLLKEKDDKYYAERDAKNEKLAAEAKRVFDEGVAKWHPRTSREFFGDLHQLYFGYAKKRGTRVLLDPLWSQLSLGFGRIYSEEFSHDYPSSERLQKKTDRLSQAYQLFLATALAALVGFTKRIPQSCTEDLDNPITSPIFTIPTDFHKEILLTEDDQQSFQSAAVSAYQYLIDALTPHQELGLFEPTGNDPSKGETLAPRDKYETDTQFRRREKDWQKITEQKWGATPQTQMLFLNSPLFHHYQYFLPPSGTLQIPFELKQETRFSSHWILGRQGRGKTVLLTHMILEDMERVARGECSVVLMDTKGELQNRFIHHERFATDLKDKLVYIEPDDLHPVSLNPLALPATSDVHASELVEYIFATFADGMSDHMYTLTKATFRAIRELYNPPTLANFRDVIQQGLKPDQIARLTDSQLRIFFQNYSGRDNLYKDTKSAIMRRLFTLHENPIVRPWFYVKKSKLNLPQLLAEGKFIVINIQDSKLGEAGAEFLGRLFIALTYGVALTRDDDLPNKPIFFYIDECTPIIGRDPVVDKAIDRVRSKKVGFVFAHQRLSRMNSDVISALGACAIRMANVEADLATQIKSKMPVDDAAALQLPTGQFCAYVSDQLTQPQTLQVRGPVQLPRMSDRDFQEMRQRMWRTYCEDMTPPEPKQPIPTQPSKPQRRGY